MSTLLTHCYTMLAQARQANATPVCFLTNASTQTQMRALCEVQEKRKVSLLVRVWKRIFRRAPIWLYLMDVPVVVSNNLPDGAVILQLAPFHSGAAKPSSDPQPMNMANVSAADNPFVERVPAKPQETDKPTLADLASKRDGMPSVTDVLIRGLEQAENLQHVVVIRVHKNNDVDLGTSATPFETSGIVQKAQIFLAQRGM